MTTVAKHSMTLRLEPTLAEAVQNTAYDLHMSQSNFIRRAIRRSLQHTSDYELPLLDERIKQALRP